MHENNFGRFVDLHNSIPFNRSLELPQEYASLVEEIASAIILRRTTQRRDSSDTKVQTCVNVLLANLVKASNMDCWLGVSMRPQAYVASRYQRGLSYKGMMDTVDYLTGDEQITLHGGFLDRTTGVSKSTRVQMTSDLQRRVMQVQRESKGKGVSGDPRRILITGTITLNEVGAPEIIRLKDEEKSLTDYDETPETERMRADLGRMNEFVARHWIDLFVTDEDLVTALDRKSPEDREERKHGLGSDENDRVLDLSRNRLHRVFNVDFQHGGRFYGPWWQALPGAIRPYITINGEPTRELDYSGLHLHMLYSKVGQPLVGDPYTLDGISPEYRKLIKITLMKMINAKGKMSRPEGLPLPPSLSWKALQEAIAEKHGAVAEYFKSGEGIRLQRLDADVAEDVMCSMMRRDILVLPIHDSFVVDWRHTAILRREMLRAYRERVGADIGIDQDRSMVDCLSAQSEQEVAHALARLEARPEYRGYRERATAFRRRDGFDRADEAMDKAA